MIIEDKFNLDELEHLIHTWFEGTPSEDEIELFRTSLHSKEFSKEVGRYAILSGYLRDQGGYLRDENSPVPDEALNETNNDTNLPQPSILNVTDISQLYEIFERNKSRAGTESLLKRIKLQTICIILLLLMSLATMGVISLVLLRDKDSPKLELADARPPVIAAEKDPKSNEPAYPHFNLSNSSKTEPSFIAVLRNAVVDDWGEMEPLTQGELLRAMHLQFTSGFLMIDFLTGTRMIIEGPADLDLKSETEVYVSKGAVSCHVSEFGRGFKIYTPEMDVIDLGTRFSLEVNGNKKPEIHVIEGKVLLQTGKDGKIVEVQENEAKRWEQGALANVDFSPDRFIQPSTLVTIDATVVEKKSTQWREWCEMLHRDQSVLVHYVAAELDKNTNTLPNLAKGNKSAGSATLIGGNFSTNRWGNGESIDFRTPVDRVMFKVPGEHQQLTLLAWVRVDALINEYNALIDCEEQRIWEANLPERYKPKPIEPPFLRGIRWEIRKNGRLQFSVCHGSEVLIPELFDWDRYISPEPVIKQESFGQWAFLAVTYDCKRKLLTQYFNGQPVHEAVVERPVGVPLAFVNIGNCGEPFDVQQFRLVGSFDEVMILDRILSAQEIVRINRLGNR